MSRDRRRKKIKPNKSVTPTSLAPNHSAENDHAAEAIVVAWMLTVVCTFAAELFSLFGWLIIVFTAGAAKWPTEALALPGLLLFVAAITGIVSLLLLGVCYLKAKTPLPVVVVGTSVVIAFLPLIAALFF